MMQGESVKNKSNNINFSNISNMWPATEHFRPPTYLGSRQIYLTINLHFLTFDITTLISRDYAR